MSEQTVFYQRHENIGVITFNRPHRLNAINVQFLRDFVQCLEIARQDEKALAIIMTGSGRAFCAGEDLKETAAGKSIETWAEETDRLQDIQRLIMRLGKPLIAAVRGYALGGGCEFAMSCDIRLASEDAFFGFPETGVGLTVTTAGTKILTQLVGLGKAKELIFTGDFIDAREAARIGLANKVVGNDDLMTESLAMARKIAERSPLALKLSRIALDLGLENSIEQTLELEAGHLLICAQSQGQLKFAQNRLSQMNEK